MTVILGTRFSAKQKYYVGNLGPTTIECGILADKVSCYIITYQDNIIKCQRKLALLYPFISRISTSLSFDLGCDDNRSKYRLETKKVNTLTIKN